MTTPALPFEPIQEIQFEGAKVKKLSVLSGGHAVLDLEGVAVRILSDEGQSHIEAINASICLGGAGLMNLHGAWAEGGDDVFRLDIVNTCGDMVDPLRLADERLRYCKLTLSSGARIGVACRRASLELHRQGATEKEESV